MFLNRLGLDSVHFLCFRRAQPAASPPGKLAIQMRKPGAEPGSFLFLYYFYSSRWSITHLHSERAAEVGLPGVSWHDLHRFGDLTHFWRRLCGSGSWTPDRKST